MPNTNPLTITRTQSAVVLNQLRPVSVAEDKTMLQEALRELAGEQELRLRVHRLTRAILARRVRLRQILDSRGAMSAYEYVSSYIGNPFQPVNQIRQGQLIAVVEATVAERLGKEVGASVAAQLRKYYYASTTDHYGPMNHPWVLNFNLLAGITCAESADERLQNVITLACASVSLNNLFFPRGFSINALGGGEVKPIRLSLLPNKGNMCAVYTYKPYTSEDIARLRQQIESSTQRHELGSEPAARLQDLVRDIYAAPEALAATNYADQVTMTNYFLWNKLASAAKKVNFVYISQEEVAARLLVGQHLFSDTLVHKILFCAEAAGCFERHFNNLPLSFSLEEKRGTYLFWYLPKELQGRRIALWKEGNYLVSQDGGYRIELTPENISGYLERKELMPSVLLTLVVLCLYHGLKCLGGMSQINYLTLFKEAYIKFAIELGDEESAAACRAIFTRDLGGEVTAAFLKLPGGLMTPATVWDILLYGGSDAFATISREARRITLCDSVSPLFPDDYPVAYGEKERDPDLVKLTSRDVIKAIGLEKRIASCATLIDDSK